MKKIYLAIAYSGMENTSFMMANLFASRLMNQGNIVFSPISHSHPIASQCDLPGDYEFWKNQAESFISWCDELHVVCLPGYLTSIGVQSEVAMAITMKKPVVYIEV